MTGHLARQATSAMARPHCTPALPISKADASNQLPAIKSRGLPMYVAIFVDQIPDDALFDAKAYARRRNPYTSVVVDETITTNPL